MSASPKRFGCLGILLVFLLILSVVFNALFVAGSYFGGVFGEASGFREVIYQKPVGQAKTKVALIRIDGVIGTMMPGRVGHSMVDDIKIQLRMALEDPAVRAIVLAIDSPGGEVTASDNLYHTIKKATATKPVVVSMGSLAASGGYYAALGGTHLFAHDTTFTGSIGVIMQALNYTDLMGKVGVEMATFKSGQLKDMLSGSRKITDAERAYVQAMVMQTYDRFVGIVAEERGLQAAALRAGVADGRVLSGKDAFAEKLVDELGDIDAAIAKAIQLGSAPGSAVIQYDAPQSFRRVLSLLGQNSQTPGKVEVHLTPGAGYALQPGRLYFLPSLLSP